MSISISEEDRQPIRITPRFLNKSPDKPRILATDIPKTRRLPVVKKVLGLLCSALGLVILFALATAFPALCPYIAGAFLFCLITSGVRKSVRRGVEDALKSS